MSLRVAVLAIGGVALFACMGGELREPRGRLYLAVYDSDNRLITKESVDLGQRVTILYTHSVEKVPVLEVFEVRGDGPLYLAEFISREPLLAYPGYEQYYEIMSHWNGRSEGPLPVGLDMRENDWFIVKGIERAKVMPLSVGSDFVDHSILVGSKVIRLREVAGGGEVVKLVIEVEE